MANVKRLEMYLQGEECPVPTIKTVDVIKQLGRNEAGETVVVQLDDAVCASDIPYQAGTLGYSSKTIKTGDSEWEIILTPNTGRKA
jgi:TusA-related sulfurtransferase